MEEIIINEIPAASAAEPEKKGCCVVDVRFRSGGKTYFFDPGELELHMGDEIIIDTARGPEYGICAGSAHFVSEREVVAPLRSVLRKATEEDRRIAAENREKEKRAFSVCQQKIEEHGLDMQLVSAECAFDGSKILFFFTAEGRVDFRELVKNLASVFRTRIELRQIGVRDKAKMVGGLGVCGRPFCCSEFLPDFQPVSIKMAKTQNLSLNPTKISGTCGRLMCCLKYEQDAYEDLIKTAPMAESFVDTPDGRGTVTDINLLRQSVRVRMEDEPETINCYNNCDICVLRSGKARKNDPPIPKDLAPISSRRREEQKKEKETPTLEPVIFRSEAVDTPVQPPEPEAPQLPQAEEEKTGRRRRKRRGSDSARENAGRAEPEQAEKPAKPEQTERRRSEPKSKPAEPKPESAAPSAEKPSEGSAEKHTSHRRYRRRKPKNPGQPAGE